MRTCIFIPAWNTRDEITRVLEAIPVDLGRACAEVFVLDNASNDGTIDVLRRRLADGFPFPVRIYRNRANLGYGGSQKVAYSLAVRKGYDFVAMLHGDGQYPAQKLPDLLAALARDERVGMSYGSRLMETVERDETPWHRRMGVKSLSTLQNLASGLKLAEWYSGFRAFRCDALRRVPFQACAGDYYFDVQIILLLALAGYRIAETPVAKRYEGNRSPVNIYRFGRQVLARVLQYPLERRGLRKGGLYRPEHWDEFRHIAPPAPETVLLPSPRAGLAA